MPEIDFPPSPDIGTIYTFNNLTWQWNGSAWIVVTSTPSGTIGYVVSLNGLTGLVGLTAGSNITIDQSGNSFIISSSASGGGGISGPYVLSLAGLSGALGLTSGSGILISPSGQTFSISNIGVISFNGITGSVTGVTTGVSNIFGPVQHFASGITINRGITLTGNLTSFGNINLFGTPPANRITIVDIDGGLFTNAETIYFGSSSLTNVVKVDNDTQQINLIIGNNNIIDVLSDSVYIAQHLSASSASFLGNITAPNIVNGISGATGQIGLVAGSNMQITRSGNTFTFVSTASGGAGTPAGVTGSVQFNTGTAFGGFTGFIWDNTNRRLGIGLTAPTKALDVVGDGEFTGDVYVTPNFIKVTTNARHWFI